MMKCAIAHTNRRNYFYISRLFSLMRKSDNFIADLLQSQSTKVALFNKLTPVVQKSDIDDRKCQLVAINGDQYRELNRWNERAIAIFTGDSVPQLAVSFNVSPKNDLLLLLKDKFNIESSFMENPFDYFKLLERDVWVKVRGLLAWHYNNLFCGLCGTETMSIESGYKRICTNSNCHSRQESRNPQWFNYPRIDPVITVLPVTKCDPINGLPACLLARKEIFPERLMSCITGFMDPGESAEIAAKRELKEEVSLECEKLIYHSSQYWPMPSSLFIAYSAVIPPSTNFFLDQNELSFAQWFNVNDVKLLLDKKHSKFFVPPTFTIMYEMLKDWYIRTI